MSGYLGGSPACPSANAINVVVQYGHRSQGFSALLSGPQARPVIEINVYATFANFPKVVIAHVGSSVSRVVWASGSRPYDQMTPAKNWVVEIGPYLPLDAWRVENPNIPDGELVAYRGAQQVATVPVDGPDALPPPASSQPPCAHQVG